MAQNRWSIDHLSATRSSHKYPPHASKALRTVAGVFSVGSFEQTAHLIDIAPWYHDNGVAFGDKDELLPSFQAKVFTKGFGNAHLEFFGKCSGIHSYPPGIIALNVRIINEDKLFGKHYLGG
uniref:Uncharacterized protein n=1 Tax=mine drainage metagenome TaxID=410659 RepID=E6QX88_9ZZZZ